MKNRITVYITSKNKAKVTGLMKGNETVSDVINKAIEKYGSKK